MNERPFICMHDPWMALCVASVLPGVPVATYGAAAELQRFQAIGVDSPLLVEPDAAFSTTRLLDDARVAAAVAAAAPAQLICFKPSARLERRAADLGARPALAKAALAQGIENKANLAALASRARVPHPEQAIVPCGGSSWDEVAARFGGDVVVQSPRGYAGRRTFRARGAADWAEISAALGGLPARVARYVFGRPGTLNAVVDAHGHVVVTAPIVQVTGLPWLTPYRLGSCGNDFSWRPQPQPGDAPYELAERMGPVLAGRGFRGQFGLDFVVEDAADGPRCSLIEVNPRLTASFALYSAWEPALLHAHLAAVTGETLAPRRLPPLAGGQLIVHNTSRDPVPPLLADQPPLLPPALPVDVDGPCVWPYPGAAVLFAGTRGRVLTRGPVVRQDGELAIDWRP
jgi:biotin carboxylase